MASCWYSVQFTEFRSVLNFLISDQSIIGIYIYLYIIKSWPWDKLHYASKNKFFLAGGHESQQKNCKRSDDTDWVCFKYVTSKKSRRKLINIENFQKMAELEQWERALRGDGVVSWQDYIRIISAANITSLGDSGGALKKGWRIGSHQNDE